jgi:hypothetical protein
MGTVGTKFTRRLVWSDASSFRPQHPPLDAGWEVRVYRDAWRATDEGVLTRVLQYAPEHTDKAQEYVRNYKRDHVGDGTRAIIHRYGGSLSWVPWHKRNLPEQNGLRPKPQIALPPPPPGWRDDAEAQALIDTLREPSAAHVAPSLPPAATVGRERSEGVLLTLDINGQTRITLDLSQVVVALAGLVKIAHTGGDS